MGNIEEMMNNTAVETATRRPEIVRSLELRGLALGFAPGLVCTVCIGAALSPSVRVRPSICPPWLGLLPAAYEPTPPHVPE